MLTDDDDDDNDNDNNNQVIKEKKSHELSRMVFLTWTNVSVVVVLPTVRNGPQKKEKKKAG